MNQPGKPQLVPLSTAATISTLSERRLRELCARGEIKSAVKPGSPRGQWKVDRAEVADRVKPRQ